MEATRGIDDLLGSLTLSAEGVDSCKRLNKAATLRLISCCCGDWGSAPGDEDQSVDKQEQDPRSGTQVGGGGMKNVS